MPPLLALTVPAFRRYDLLTKMLASAQASLVRPDHYLIVDNGSRFDWAMIETEPTIADCHLYEPKRNIGVAAAWNYALDHCKTEYLAIVNDDVVLGPTALGRLVGELALSSSCCAVAGCWALFVVRPKVLIERAGHFDENLWPAYYEDDDMRRRLLLADDPVLDVQDVDYSHVGSATTAGFGAAEQREHDLNFGRVAHYYRKKWSGMPRKERNTEPFQGKYPRDWTLRPAR